MLAILAVMIAGLAALDHHLYKLREEQLEGSVTSLQSQLTAADTAMQLRVEIASQERELAALRRSLGNAWTLLERQGESSRIQLVSEDKQADGLLIAPLESEKIFLLLRNLPREARRRILRLVIPGEAFDGKFLSALDGRAFAAFPKPTETIKQAEVQLLPQRKVMLRTEIR